jgi:hypothetical protein
MGAALLLQALPEEFLGSYIFKKLLPEKKKS